MTNASLTFTFACLAAAPVLAGPRTTLPSVQLDTGLVIVPFAVPVAVPVAVVQHPPVVYGYRVGVAGRAAESAGRAEPDGAPRLDLAPAAILARHCAACHTGGAASGGLELFGADGRLRGPLPRQAILESVTPDEHGAARMPPAGRGPLSADELRALGAWARPPRDLEW